MHMFVLYVYKYNIYIHKHVHTYTNLYTHASTFVTIYCHYIEDFREYVTRGMVKEIQKTKTKHKHRYLKIHGETFLPRNTKKKQVP